MQRTTDTYRSSVLPLATAPQSSGGTLSRQNRDSLFTAGGQSRAHLGSGSMAVLMGRADPGRESLAERKRQYKAELDQQLGQASQSRPRTGREQRQADKSIVENMERLAEQRREFVSSAH